MTDRVQTIHRRPHRIAAPAAGAEISITPNTGFHWRLMGLIFTLTTSAVVPTRNVSLTLTDGTSRTFKAITAAVQAASLAIDYTLYPDAVPAGITNNTVVMAIPPDGLWMPKGWVLATATAALDVGDQYSGIVVDIQEIPDGPLWTAEPSMALTTVLLDQ